MVFTFTTLWMASTSSLLESKVYTKFFDAKIWIWSFVIAKILCKNVTVKVCLEMYVVNAKIKLGITDARVVKLNLNTYLIEFLLHLQNLSVSTDRLKASSLESILHLYND